MFVIKHKYMRIYIIIYNRILLCNIVYLFHLISGLTQLCAKRKNLRNTSVQTVLLELQAGVPRCATVHHGAPLTSTDTVQSRSPNCQIYKIL